MADAGEGMLRAAETLLRASGRAVLLRMPQPAVAGDDAEVLGLSTPQFHDVELQPCVFRRTGSTDELLVSAEALKRVVGSLEFDSARVLFETAACVVVDAGRYRVIDVCAEESGGVAVCYRVALQRMAE